MGLPFDRATVGLNQQRDSPLDRYRLSGGEDRVGSWLDAVRGGKLEAGIDQGAFHGGVMGPGADGGD